jgi:tetratricopeptide (TPR) repeat protein
MARKADPNLRIEPHPLYGEVRLIRRTAPAKSGRTVEWWEYDPSFQPRLPRGALRGDPTKQIFCTAHHVPKYFYVDERRECIQCGAEFTFEAAEQKFWYETLKFNFNSVAIRCPDCRRRRRTEAALRNQIAKARADLDRSPEDPATLLALGEALVRYRQRTGQGSLADAIAAARKAKALWPEAIESSFWEGLAHHLAGRTQRARECLKRFLERSAGTRRLSAFAEEAKEVLSGDHRAA